MKAKYLVLTEKELLQLASSTMHEQVEVIRYLEEYIRTGFMQLQAGCCYGPMSHAEDMAEASKGYVKEIAHA